MKKLILIPVLILFVEVAFSQSQTKTKDTGKHTPIQSTTAFRMHYEDLFRRNASGAITPMQPLQINGEMVSTAMKIAPGIKYGGIDVASYAGHDMLVDTLGGVVIIRKFLP